MSEELVNAAASNDWFGLGWLELSLITIIVLLSISIIKQFLDSTRNSSPPSATAYVSKPPIVQRDFTLEELREYDGRTSDTPIYIALKGKVYDVSSRGMFYGPGGPYHIFAGRDASRSLATDSLEEKDVVNPSLEGLSQADLSTLNDWVQTYESRYDVVGKLVPTKRADNAKE